MKWNLDVPKILHVYWSATPMYYLRYMTVVTFIEHNPDWKVMLWLPKYPYKVVTWETQELNYELKIETDYFPELLKLPIEINYVDMEDLGMSNKMSESHKSDQLRYCMLYKYGGVYADMDILFFKPITYLKENIIENKEVITYVCICHYGHSTGLLMACAGSKFFEIMMKKRYFDPLVFQSIGPDAVNETFATIKHIEKISTVVNLSMKCVYAHDALHIPDIYNTKTPKFTKNSIGIHWYGGHPLTGEFLKNTNGGLKNLSDNIIGNLL